jgi:hypothetical protein
MKVFAHYFGRSALKKKEFVEWSLVEEFNKKGVDFVQDYSADELWVFDFSIWALFHLVRWPRSKRKLFVFEPRAVNPLQHKEWVRSLFSTTYVFSEAQCGLSGKFVEGGGFNPSRVEESMEGLKKDTESLEFVSIAVAAGDKQSLEEGSLYWLRRDCMDSLSHLGYQVKLAGPFWQSSTFFRFKQLGVALVQTLASCSTPRISLARPGKFVSRSRPPNFEYLGFVKSEIAFYSSCDVVLVIENDIESLSEKLFSALCSGRWVVYVGPPEARKFESLRTVLFSDPSVEGVTAALKRISRSQAPPVSDLSEVLAHRSSRAFYKRLAKIATE